MLPKKILEDRFWLLLAIILLVVEWSMPVVAQAFYAEAHVISALVFAAAWACLMAGLGLQLYRSSRKNPQMTSVTIVLALVTTVVLYRTPFRFIEPQFWAEDGAIFFLQQHQSGLGAFFISQAGYYHTTVRFFAALAACGPTLFLPAFYDLSWLAIYSLVVAYMLVQYPNKAWAPAVVLATAIVSQNGEVYMILTNLIWIVGLGLTAFLLLPVPGLKPAGRYVLAGVLLVFSATGPFSVVLAPFYFLRWIVERKAFPLEYVVPVAAGAAIQMTAIHSIHTDNSAVAPFNSSTVGEYLQVAVQEVVWFLAAGYQPYGSYWLIGLVIFLVLLGFIAWEVSLDFKRHIFSMGCLFLCAIWTAVGIMRSPSLDSFIVLPGYGDRYFFIPRILLAWALIHLASSARNPKPFYLALFFCVMGSIVKFNTTLPEVDFAWPHYAALVDEGKPSLRVPINPPGWSALVNEPSSR